MWKRWFSDSETILWARVQMAIGAIVAVVASIDPMIFEAHIPSNYIPFYILASGFITEFARRLRDKDL